MDSQIRAFRDKGGNWHLFSLGCVDIVSWECTYESSSGESVSSPCVSCCDCKGFGLVVDDGKILTEGKSLVWCYGSDSGGS